MPKKYLIFLIPKTQYPVVEAFPEIMAAILMSFFRRFQPHRGRGQGELVETAAVTAQDSGRRRQRGRGRERGRKIVKDGRVEFALNWKKKKK